MATIFKRTFSLFSLTFLSNEPIHEDLICIAKEPPIPTLKEQKKRKIQPWKMRIRESTEFNSLFPPFNLRTVFCADFVYVAKGKMVEANGKEDRVWPMENPFMPVFPFVHLLSSMREPSYRVNGKFPLLL